MFENRDTRRVVLARFISRTGGEAAFFIGIWGKAAYTFRATAAQLAVLMAVLAVTGIAGSILSGILVDRFDPRRVLMGAELVFVPVTLSMAFASSLPVLIVLTGLHGFFGAPVFTAVASFGPFLVEDMDRLERVNSGISAAGSAAMVSGPAVGAFIVSVAALDWVFVLDAATSLVAVALVMGVTLRQREPARVASRRPLAELREGFRACYGSRGLRYFILVGTAMWLGFGAFGALEPLFYRDVLRTGVVTLGWVNAVFGAGLLAGAWLLPRLPRRLVTARGLALLAFLTGLGAVLYVGTADIRVVAAGALVWAVVIGVADPLMRTLIQSDSPDELVGRIAGTSAVHQQAGELVPLAFAPVLAVRFGVQRVLIANGLVLAGLAALTFAEAMAVDRVPRLRAPEPVAFAPSDEPVSPNP